MAAGMTNFEKEKIAYFLIQQNLENMEIEVNATHVFPLCECGCNGGILKIQLTRQQTTLKVMLEFFTYEEYNTKTNISEFCVQTATIICSDFPYPPTKPCP